MAIARELLEILVCPEDHARVQLVGPADAPTGLKCEQCQRVYPIRDDIPVMLLEEARRDTPNG